MGFGVALLTNPGGIGSRDVALDRLSSSTERFDVLVVGGGITGAGIALDAASRGLRVALVERFDFASGTSSKSSKLVHGGLRYLEQYEFGLVREASLERGLLERLAPQLVESLPFVIPVSDRWLRAKFGVGMWAYDALASFKNTAFHKYIDAETMEAMVPALPKGKVRGGYLYYDSKTDDARLVMEVLVQAVRLGAVVANYAAVRDLDTSKSGCCALIEDTLDGDLFEVGAHRVIVAGGVWNDRIESLGDATAQPRLRPSKGIHLVFRSDAVPLTETATFIPDADRKRMLFLIPWQDHVVVGTTDSDYEGDLDHPCVTHNERSYVLGAVNASLGLNLQEDDVVGAWAGLRPLVRAKDGSTVDLSRSHVVYDLAPGAAGITGGKLTTYRRMARDAVDRVVGAFEDAGGSRTRWIKLGCVDVDMLRRAVARRCERLALPEESGGHLIRCYGDRALAVLEVAAETGLTEALVPGHPPIGAEAVYCARSEMAVQLSDLLARRTRLALTDRSAGIGPEDLALQLMSSELSWSTHESGRQALAYRGEIEAERGAPLQRERVGSAP
ncbi:MAG: glycerol-3-phosphate dehydrogenase/oxidase [Actinomycetota bacterium]